MINTGSDVIGFLERQHKEIEAAFERVLETCGEDRSRAFFALRRLLAIHEAAEEEVVHPAAQRTLPDGQVVVAARLREERDAKAVLTELEKLDVESSEFETELERLATDVIAHAKAEEAGEFERLGAKLDQAWLTRMRTAVEIAESIAPTRPHAGIESAAANLIVGPFAAMVDRARDALARKA